MEEESSALSPHVHELK